MVCKASLRSIQTLLGALLMLVLLAGTVGAEPIPIRTTPLDGEILQRTPTAVGIGFDQALDPEQSTFRLLHPDGSDVADTSTVWSTNTSSVTISLPRDFPDGVYTIVWHAVAASDGSVSDGWSSFSVGNPEDANILTIPTNASGHQVPPAWLRIAARAIAFIGVAASLAVWPIWRGVIRPALGRERSAARSTTASMQRWSLVVLAVALVGSLLDLLLHSQSLRDAGLIDATMQTLGHEEWGFWWLARMTLLVVLGIGLAISPWWLPGRAKVINALLWIVSLALPLTLAFGGHVMTITVGRITTVFSQYLAHLSLALLLGLGSGLVIALRHVETDAARRIVRSRSIWLVVSAATIAALTWGYLGDVFAGNLDALTQTDFGAALLALIGLGVVAIVVAVLLVRQVPTRPLAIAFSAIMALLVVTTAAMDVHTPARTELVERSVQTREHLDFDGRAGILLIAPGRAGVNHLRLETPGTYLQTETEVFLDLSSPDHPEIGTKQVQMYRVQGNAFEHHGTEFSLLGDWQITVRIQEPGFEPSTSTFSQVFGVANTTVQVPAAPMKFDTLAGLAGLGLAIVGILGLSTALVAGKGPLRKEAAGLAGIAIVLAVVVIAQGRIDPVLVVESGEGAINPNDMVMVARGEETYTNYCASCHGTSLRGDGPLAEALVPPPVDFSAPHAKVHSNEDLIYWIQYGMQGTAMPGFRSQLTDQDIRDVIAYMQHWQQNEGDPTVANATPEAGVCEVAPVPYTDLSAIFHHGLHPDTRRGTPLVRAADSTVSPEDTNDILWTIEQMVNCANQDEFLAQIRLFSEPMLQEVFPQGLSWEVTSRATSAPEPLAADSLIRIADVQSVAYLADGRVAVTVIFADPAGVGVIPGATPVYQITLILVNDGDVWLIDEAR